MTPIKEKTTTVTYSLIECEDEQRAEHLAFYINSNVRDDVATQGLMATFVGREVRAFRKDLGLLNKKQNDTIIAVVKDLLERRQPKPILDGRKVYRLSAGEGKACLTHAVGPTVQWAEGNSICDVPESLFKKYEATLRDGTYGDEERRAIFTVMTDGTVDNENRDSNGMRYARQWLADHPE